MTRALSRLRRDRSGVALIEFAYAMPVLLALGFMGTEVATYALGHMRISQLTLTAADNASRLGEANALSVRQLREQDIDDVFEAARLQSRGLEIYQHGRMIISSLQQDEDGRQTIAWQRCRGLKAGQTSMYGPQGTTADAPDEPLPGIASTGRTILARPDGAVILVETFYDYQPVADFAFSSIGPRGIDSTAVFTVRDKRNLDEVTNPSPAAVVQTCDILTG